MAYVDKSPQNVTPIADPSGSIKLGRTFERHYFNIYFYNNAEGIDPGGVPVFAFAGTGTLEVSRDGLRWSTVRDPQNINDIAWSVAGSDIMVRFAPGNYEYARFTPAGDIVGATHYRLIIDSDTA